MVEDKVDADQVISLVEIPERLAYGVEFHPDFPSNGFLFLFTNGPTGQEERKNCISRFSLVRKEDGSFSCSAESEVKILEWRSMGHDGGDLCFGHDGMLYISSGDGSSDSDNWLSAQDPTNLLGGILRIDVDHTAQDLNYSIPVDNPFLEIPGARGELWAIGLRNPWRISVDQQSGRIWVGNNGQDLWESIHLLGRAENYGWSVYEGSHPFYIQRQLGPGKLVAPTMEHHHSQARSLTGGVVYYGRQWPELDGAYLYGDYATGRIWAAKHDGQQMQWHREIADTVLQIACFANAGRGEILIVDHAGGIYRLVSNPVAHEALANKEFPRQLSQTGLFDSTKDYRVAPGVLAYSVNSPGWNDGAQALHHLALPDQTTIEYTKTRGWNFPNGCVLMQTLQWPLAEGMGRAVKRIETRLLVRYQSEWTGYSYLWNDSQEDAFLVDEQGLDLMLHVNGAELVSGSIPWRVPSRSECMACHSRAVNYVLSMTHLQLDRKVSVHDQEWNQFHYWKRLGLFGEAAPNWDDSHIRLVNPYDVTQDLNARARSYLHTNCSSCHVEAGGGNARMLLELETPIEEMNVLSHFPQHDTFSLNQPRIIDPGIPQQSVLLSRLERRGRGQMPPLVSQTVDRVAVELFRQWISSLPPDRPFIRQWSMEDFIEDLSDLNQVQPIKDGATVNETGGTSVVPAIDEQLPKYSLELGRQVFREAGCGQCHQMRDELAGIGPSLNGIGTRMKPSDILTAILSPSQTIAEPYATTVLVTESGQIFQGRIEEETADFLSLRLSEAPTTVQRVSKSDIEQRGFSKVSSMPQGTLDRFERQEILNLVAFLLSEPASQP